MSSEKIFWTKNMNLKLVKYVQGKPSIWNSKHPKYTAVDLRDKLFAEFASKYGIDISGPIVKRRWTNIRSTFAYNLRKLKVAEERREKPTINWHLWDACQFLRNTKNDDVIQEYCSDSEVNDSKNDSTDLINQENPSISCDKLAKRLVSFLDQKQSLKNEFSALGIEVAECLSQMTSLQAARMSCKIMEVLLLYDDYNPDNPNH